MAKAIYSAIANLGVTHFCAAPDVLNSLLNAPLSEKILPLPRTVNVMIVDESPPVCLLTSMSQQGFHIIHTYDLTETYGLSTICTPKPEWDLLPPETRARQGVRHLGLEGLDVVNQETMTPTHADGKTIGEIVMRGNCVMKGYLKNPEANREAFAGGWFHSGDLGVKHTNGYIEVKDRPKDIIISGGENISSLEVENLLYQHPEVLEVSVVARPDERWGESPCAFVDLKPDANAAKKEDAIRADIVRFCREKMLAPMWPKSVVFGSLPKTAIGKIQKHILRKEAKDLEALKNKRLRSSGE